jgi:hypothetical protein
LGSFWQKGLATTELTIGRLSQRRSIIEISIIEISIIEISRFFGLVSFCKIHFVCKSTLFARSVLFARSALLARSALQDLRWVRFVRTLTRDLRLASGASASRQDETSPA